MYDRGPPCFFNAATTQATQHPSVTLRIDPTAMLIMPYNYYEQWLAVGDGQPQACFRGRPRPFLLLRLSYCTSSRIIFLASHLPLQ
jgi:hypothetical protein